MKVSTIKKAFTTIMIIATIAVSINILLGGTVNATLGIPSVSAGSTPNALKTTTQNVLTIVAYLCYTAAARY